MYRQDLTTADTFTPAIRRNWGYWDGRNYRAMDQLPEWARANQYRPQHPHDKPYGEGFWVGWYGEPAPDKYSAAALAAGG